MCARYDRACVRMKFQEKREMVHLIFITLVPSFVAPMYSYETNVFENTPYIAVCLYILECHTYILVCYSYILVFYCYALVCYWYALVCYCYTEYLHGFKFSTCILYQLNIKFRMFSPLPRERQTLNISSS